MNEYNPHDPTHRAQLGNSLTDWLTGREFVRRPAKSLALTEDIFEREVVAGGKPTGLFVVVYTSIVNGSVRAKDSDAIRVTVEGRKKDGTMRGIAKSKRVFRTGTIEGILERTLERMREAYKRGLKANGDRCKSCGAPLFVSRKENLVCLDLCWLKK